MRIALFVLAVFLFVLSVTEGQSEQLPTAEEVVANAEARYKEGVTNEDTTLSLLTHSIWMLSAGTNAGPPRILG